MSGNEEVASSERSDAVHAVLIIGAGPGGICTAIGLKEAGIDDIVVLEKSAGTGGTWFNNRYPGLACDVVGDHYSYSFFQDFEWSRPYPRPAEFMAYLERTIDHYGLRPHILLGTGATRAVWLDEQSIWEVTDVHGAVHRARIVVGALGMFNEAVRPDINGLEEFHGPIVHTADWPHDDEGLLAGKHVAVIGSAASAIQLVPAIAPEVAHLDVYQRTANWVFPKDDPRFSDDQLADRRRDPALRQEARAASFELLLATLGGVDDPALTDELRQAAMENLSQVDDPELRDRLTPRVPIGAQRPLLSSEYYPAFNNEHVELITAGIREVTAEAVVTTDGVAHPTDLIVLATGYAAWKFLSAIDVVGRQGVGLGDLWRDGAYAYLGITVDHFPNLFMMYGPNTNGGSILDKLETQADYISRKIRHILDHDIDSLEVRHDVVRDYNVRVQELLGSNSLLHVPDGSKYYRAPSGRIVTQCPFDVVAYDELTRADDRDAFIERTRSATR